MPKDINKMNIKSVMIFVISIICFSGFSQSDKVKFTFSKKIEDPFYMKVNDMVVFSGNGDCEVSIDDDKIDNVWFSIDTNFSGRRLTYLDFKKG